MSAAAEPSVVSVEVVSVGGGPADSHLFGVRDLVAMRRVGGPVVSPDAKHIAFTVKELDPAQEHRATTSVWLMSAVELDGGRQLTRAEFKSDSEPAWCARACTFGLIWNVLIYSHSSLCPLQCLPVSSSLTHAQARQSLAGICQQSKRIQPGLSLILVAPDC